MSSEEGEEVEESKTSIHDSNASAAVFLDWAELMASALEIRREAAYQDARVEALIRDSLCHIVRFVFCYGICMSIASVASPTASLHISLFFQTMHPAWDALHVLFDIAFEDRTLLTEVVEGINLWAEATGVDAITCLLTLCFPSDDEEPHFASQGMRLLASPVCLQRLTAEVIQTEADWEDQEEGEHKERIPDREYLVMAGVHQKLAGCIEDLTSEHFLLVWGLLLTCAESGSPSYRKQMSGMLRDVTSLVYYTLNALMDWLPLPPVTTKKSIADQLEEKRQLEREVMRRDVFSLQELLQSMGLPQNEKEWTVLAMKIYHVMLEMIPVAVRHWVHDLKFKRHIKAVKQYTTACESPALIEREFQLLSANRLTEESGFVIRANIARREVVAILEGPEVKPIIELTVKIPECLPLKPASVECDVNVRSIT